MAAKSYENNPFLVALEGINIVFQKARGPAIFLIVVSILGAFSSGASSGTPTDTEMNQTPQQVTDQTVAQLSALSATEWTFWASAILLITLAFIFAMSMISGISAYTSAQLARDKKVTLSHAFHGVLDHFFSYIWLQAIIIVKVLLWSLLFIVPGIIMAFRYSLANVAFFDKNLRGNAAVKESLRLTKGAWLTTFASQILFNLITLGVIEGFVNTGVKTVLYRQFNALGKKDEKPAAHILSWVTLALPFVLVGLLIMLALLFVGVAILSGAYDIR